MDSVSQITIQLIRSIVCQNPVDEKLHSLITERKLVEILILSKKHGVAPIVATALQNEGLLENSPQQDLFLRELYSAVYLQEKTSFVYDKVCTLFEENKIKYIPLKGAVVRDLYPQPWMRTSCDIDILVNESDLNTATDILVKSADMTLKAKSKHDVQLVSGDGICLELHFSLIGNKKSQFYSDVFKNIWNFSSPVCEKSFKYKLSDDVFYYYHIVHMAKHFKLGGCGLRPFIDLWLIRHSGKFDLTECNMLKNNDISDFEYYARKLSEVWFEGKTHDDITLSIQRYITDGGSFGSESTRAFANSHRHGGKIIYYLSRVFVPYSYLKAEYKILEKYPFLTPFFGVLRIFSILFGKKKKFKNRQIENINNARANEIYCDDLFKILGL